MFCYEHLTIDLSTLCHTQIFIFCLFKGFTSLRLLQVRTGPQKICAYVKHHLCGLTLQWLLVCWKSNVKLWMKWCLTWNEARPTDTPVWRGWTNTRAVLTQSSLLSSVRSSRSHLPFTDCLEHFIPVINCRALYIVTGQYMSTAVINDEMHHSAHCHYQSVDVHSFCQLIRRHSFWSHPSFRAFCWPETDEVYLWHHFYCATPCIVWTMLLQDVCLSVRLSKRFNLSSDFITIG